MKKSEKTMIGSAMITAIAAVPLAFAAENPFGAQELKNGYMQVAEAADSKSKEMSCGEGKCGGSKKSADPAKAKEMSCGEGKCGGKMKKPDATPADETPAAPKEESKPESAAPQTEAPKKIQPTPPSPNA